MKELAVLTKTTLQEYGLRNWILTPGNILFEFSMGTGKSLLALNIIEHELKYNPNLRVCLVTNSVTAITKTWTDEVRKHGKEHLNKHISYYHYGNAKPGPYDLLVLDEAHLIRPKIESLIISSRRTVMFTGTYPENEEKKALIKKYVLSRNIFKFSLSDAINHKLVNSYQINILQVPRDVNTEWTNTYLYYCQKIHNLPTYEAKQPFMLQRMSHIYKHPNKLLAARFITDRYRKNGRRFIGFVASKEHASKISTSIKYSGNPSKDLHLNRFINEEVNELITVDQIREGANIPRLLFAFINQINGNSGSTLQKVGRLLRSENKDEVGVIWITVIRDTYDTVWLNRNLKKLDNSKVAYYSVSQEVLNNYKNDRIWLTE